MLVFERLRKKYSFKPIKLRGATIRSRPINRAGIFERFLNHWRDADRHEWPNQPWYTGTGLHYSQSCGIAPYSRQLCGNSDNRADYQDTLSYDQEVVPGLLDGFGSFPTVRCKITQLSGKSLGAQIRGHLDWHRDETPFEVLRVVIPLSSDLTYQFQMDNSAPMSLIPGHAYAFDQSRFHRVYSNDASDLDRTHLILSFVTWFDQVDGEWKPNPFFGKIHPLELFDLVDL